MKSKIVYSRTGKRTYYLGDREVTQLEYEASTPSRIGEILRDGFQGHCQTPQCWPMTSEALAVHPSQIERANDRNKRHGVATRYTHDGIAVIPDRGDRKRLLKLEGMHDNSGGYGD